MAVTTILFTVLNKEVASLLIYQYDDIVNSNSFKVTNSNIDEADTKTNSINESDDHDDFIYLK